MQFFLGTHQPGWLTRTRASLFVSFPRLRVYKTLPRAKSSWALDSGAFSELVANTRWTVPPRKYADSVRRLQQQIGKLEWASIQDWICSPMVLQRTGLTITTHQKRTIENLHVLRYLAPEITWLPVLQGWNLESYLAHFEMYKSAGIRLVNERLVGVGSLANRQRSDDVVRILATLRTEGIAAHAFGLSLAGLKRVSCLVESADSMAWSFTARKRRIKHKSCQARHPTCNNCLIYALWWRRHLLSRLGATS
jgi:hypothetical protein